MFTTMGYEPLRTIAILMVAAVVSAQWVLRDKLSTVLASRAEHMELARKLYLRLRGLPDYHGRHRV